MLGRPLLTMAVVSAEQIDDYLRGVEEPTRSTLQALRRTILDVIPDAEQAISYGVPAFRMQGTTVAGFAAFKDHLIYLPHSGAGARPQAGACLLRGLERRRLRVNAGG
jgi:uncharacterized protein YdhG (YjbR/CyaY superfamily)